MNFSNEGAKSEKVHQVEPKKKIIISRYSLARFNLLRSYWVAKNDIAYQLHNRC